MRQVQLLSSHLATSAVGFGTSRVHYLRAPTATAIIRAALDVGISHFDTAPAYGDGIAEHVLGRALAGARARVTIATKYGIPPDPLIDRAGLPVVAAKVLRRVVPRGTSASRPPLTPAGLVASVAASLRRLRTDYIDLLLLHEPAVDRAPDLAGLMAALEQLRAAGTIRGYGLAGRWPSLLAMRTASQVVDLVMQTAETEWHGPEVPDITYGCVSQGPQSFRQPAVDSSVALARLRAARMRRPAGVVLVSTTRPDRVAALAEAAA